jgi:hypothetical protein
VTALLLLLAGAMQGCRSGATPQGAAGPAWPYGPGERPRFTMLYLPYPQDGVPLALPTPTVYGWTDERMTRDLSRFRAAGLDGLILGLQPGVFTDALQSERVVHFLDLVARQAAPAFRVVLLLVPPALAPAATSIEAEYIGKWLTSNDLLHLSCLERGAGQIMLVCPPGTAVTGPPHPALCVVRTDAPGAPWTWGDPAVPARLQPTGPDRQVLVYAGWRGRNAPVGRNGQPRWEIERRQGRSLEAEIRSAYAVKAGLICISSWNNYVAGDFVEPNSLDGDHVLRRLTALIRQAREAAQAPAAPGGQPPSPPPGTTP